VIVVNIAGAERGLIRWFSLTILVGVIKTG